MASTPLSASVDKPSILSDALLRQLMAVGQVDILVGLPTLNNAATVGAVVRAIHVCFTRDYPRLRTVMINSDAGSTDGTPGRIRDASLSDEDVVQTSHALRTLHRVVTPYHGLPGKHTALRTLFAAAELTQAKVLVVIDPAGPATDAGRVTELIEPVLRGKVEFLAPRFRRHPRDGALITQLVRPLVRTLYGVGLDEPLGAEFACSRRFAAHCLDQRIWSQDAARFAIDLWLRTEAIAGRFTIGQIWRPSTTGGGTTTLRQAVRQIMLSLAVSLRAHEGFWRQADGVAALPTWGTDHDGGDYVEWDYFALAQQARHDLAEIRPLLEEGPFDPALVSSLIEDTTAAEPRFHDELWVKVVYGFFVRTNGRGTAGIEQLADMFVPIYMWRAAVFMMQTSGEAADRIQARLDALCHTFQRLRSDLVSKWTAEL
jgi:glucosylglycerate synthase